MRDLITELRKINLNETTNIFNIAIAWKEGNYPDYSAVEFWVVYEDGSGVKYRSEASPYILKTFLFYVSKKWYGAAMDSVKQYTEKI
jgi:hypothetical protein